VLIPGLALALLIGLSLGILGGGGSIITVPIFVYVLGIEAKPAIAMSLAVVGATAAVGAASHWRDGNVNVRVAFVFGGFAMVGTFLGARLALFVSGPAQLTIFAVVMLLGAWFMFRGPREIVAPALPTPRTQLSTAQHGTALRDLPLGLIALEGLGVGALTGLVGVGGGFMIVPALVLLTGLPMKHAVGTSLVIIALKSATGFIGYLDQVVIDWGFMAAFTAVAAAGILVGARLVRRIPQAALRQAFALMLVVMGVLILYQNRGVLSDAFAWRPDRMERVAPD
jgi:uncharacterized protein